MVVPFILLLLSSSLSVHAASALPTINEEDPVQIGYIPMIPQRNDLNISGSSDDTPSDDTPVVRTTYRPAGDTELAAALASFAKSTSAKSTSALSTSAFEKKVRPKSELPPTLTVEAKEKSKEPVSLHPSETCPIPFAPRTPSDSGLSLSDAGKRSIPSSLPSTPTSAAHDTKGNEFATLFEN